MKTNITDADILHIAELSRIKLSESEMADMKGHLEHMITHFDALDSVDVSDVPPTAHILSAVNVLRDDEVKPSMPTEELMQNAPETDGGAYIVPRVVE